MTFVNNGIKLSCSVFTFSNLTQKTIGKWSQTRATEFEGSSLRFQKSPFPNQTFIYIWHSACGRYISARISNYCLGECLLYLKVVIAVNSRWKAWLLPPYSKCIVRLVFGHLEKNSSPKNLKILFVFSIDDPKQNATSILTPLSNIVFYALSSGTLGFALHGSSVNHFLIGGNSSTANQILPCKWLLKLP